MTYRILIMIILWCIIFSTYRIWPNYCTVCLGFSKLLGTLSCVKICINLLTVHYKKKDQKRTYLMMIMRFSFLIFLIKAYAIDAIHMNIHKTCLYKEVDKNYTGCNLKTTKLPDCALIGVCGVIRSNTVYILGEHLVRSVPLIIRINF